MIIGERFAWAHLGKTGGDATLALFRIFPELILHADDSTTSDKHMPFQAREDQTRGKLLVLNSRRLPSWMLSFAHHRAKWGLHPDYTPLPMWTPDEMADSAAADAELHTFTDNGRLTINRWLRTEYLRWDFLAFISRFTTISDEQLDQVLNLDMINAATYNHRVDHWFTRDQIARMYANNPQWAAIEARAYADATLPVAGQMLQHLHRRLLERSAEQAAAQRELAALRSQLKAQTEQLAQLSNTVIHLTDQVASLQSRWSPMRSIRQLAGRQQPDSTC